MNWNNLERSGRSKIVCRLAIPTLPEGTEEIHKIVRIIDVLAEIRTGHLPNAISKRQPPQQIYYFKWLKKDC
jgi:hypothetical protein